MAHVDCGKFMKIATSPDRGSFNRKIIQDQYEKSKISEEDYIKWIELMDRAEEEREIEKDLEFDLRSCVEIVEKCKKSENYSKKLYAALCNNIFEKDEKEYSCSWRHSGGIVADLNEKGDYIDWYCSGNEGILDEEICADLKKIGWSLKKHLGTDE